MAKIFEAVGLSSGHEALFNPLQNIWPPERAGVESSWLAAPFLDQLPSHVHVVHQVRHPLAVIRSFMGYDFFGSSNPYVSFCYRHAPEIGRQQGALGRCMQYWISWNEMVESYGAPRHRVEDLSAPLLVDIAASAGFEIPEEEFAVALEKWGDVKVGHLSTPPRFRVSTRELLEHPLGQRLKELAYRYGYDIEDEDT